MGGGSSQLEVEQSRGEAEPEPSQLGMEQSQGVAYKQPTACEVGKLKPVRDAGRGGAQKLCSYRPV